ncbi:MAG: nicotinate-nucleotide--dimethylbenzimidazole phosphoribosyltransferase [Acidobacteria bacterium]|nr:nicotinate-nucleotide--dimethylbenzimidazole phosphoribosyltransferase [Acidobacteriota bacterium]
MKSSILGENLLAIRPLFDEKLAAALNQSWNALPKPTGSLGKLESLVVHYGLVRGTATPLARRKGLVLFAADHGVVHEGVTAGTQEETRNAVELFLRGGTAANVLCRNTHTETVVVDAGVRGAPILGTLDRKSGEGSQNFTKSAALTEQQLFNALETGIELATEFALRFDIVGLGQIGLGGGCSAAAILSALSGRDAADCTILEEGLEESLRDRRLQAVRSAVRSHQKESITPLGVLRTLGGLDLAQMTGFLLGAARRRLPVMLDGFTAGSAAALARALAPDSPDAFLFSHVTPSRPHNYLLKFLSVEPLLDLQITEETGFGAALGLQLLDTALQLHAEIGAPHR